MGFATTSAIALVSRSIYRWDAKIIVLHLLDPTTYVSAMLVLQSLKSPQLEKRIGQSDGASRMWRNGNNCDFFCIGAIMPKYAVGLGRHIFCRGFKNFAPKLFA